MNARDKAEVKADLKHLQERASMIERDAETQPEPMQSRLNRVRRRHPDAGQSHHAEDSVDA